jgi:predicted O-methyltransferase YrrM
MPASIDLSTVVRIGEEYHLRLGRWSDLGQHMRGLHDLALDYEDPTVVELGVREGASTIAFLDALTSVGGHLYSIDIDHPKVPIWWADTGLWTFLIGDDVSPAVIAEIPERIDILFIDSSHYYQQTIDELDAYAYRVRPGGLILLHDTELSVPPGWTGDPFPVRRALETWCPVNGFEWTNRPGDSGLGMIRP